MVSSMKSSRVVFLLLILVAVFQVFLYRDQLPERVASHFDGQGNPNGFMPRQGLLAFHLGLVAFLAAIFLFLPAVLLRIPNALINLPRKDYWLAPERREATLRRMGADMTWFGVATLAFLLVVEQLVFQANVPGGTGKLPSVPFWIALGSYLLFTTVWMVPLLLRYLRVPPDQASRPGTSSP